MIPRNLDDLRRQLAYSQRSEPHVQDEFTLESREYSNTNANYANNRSQWPREQLSSRPPDSHAEMNEDTYAGGFGAQTQPTTNSINPSFYGYNERQNVFSRVDPQAAYAEVMYSSDHPALREWPSSQPHMRLPGGFQDMRVPPVQGNVWVQHSQSQAMPHQPASQFTSRFPPRPAIMPGGSQPNSFPGCISSTHKRNRAELAGPPEPLKELNFGQRANLASNAAPSRTAHHDASMDGAMHIRQDSQAMGLTPSHLPAVHRIQQSFSQSCSTQAETVTSTQRAAACEPPKMQMHQQTANIKRLQSYMRLDGIVKHDDIRYYKYIDERPGIKPNYWLKCAYCTSNKIYRRVETLRKHMETKTCPWVPGSQVPIQPSSENTQGREVQQQQKKNAQLPPNNSSANTRLETMPTESENQQVVSERQYTGQQASAVEVQAATEPPRRLVPLCGGSVSEANLLTSRLLNRQEIGDNPFGIQRESNRQRAGVLSPRRLTANCSLSSRSLEVMPVSMAARNQQNSPLSSAVSTCLEELPLEQLLGRLSDKDIQSLLQSTIHAPSSSLSAPIQQKVADAARQQEADEAKSAEFNQECMQPQITTERNALQPLVEEPPQRVEEVSADVQQSDQQQPPSPTTLAEAETPSAEEKALSNASPPSVFKEPAKPKALTKKIRASKPQPTSRTCAVQTELRMNYLEKVLFFYENRKNNTNPICTEKRGKEGSTAKALPRSKSQKKAKKLKTAKVLKPSSKPTQVVKRSSGRIAKKAVERREKKNHQLKVEKPRKHSQRLSGINQGKQEESEVLRQQSCDYPELLVGAALMIKEKNKPNWEPCIVGEYFATTGRHDVTLPCSVRKRLRLSEQELLIKRES